ncbi:methyl-accepting chemotaxis protein [Roseateles noduli]|uniref:methyl-accepting chemotaxis protein n=1 Tax=Roseateles noduli TaxID=2052484 RepID=UPI003D657778
MVGRRHLTVRTQLIAAFTGLALLMLLVAGLSLKALHDANQHFVSFVQGINARAAVAEHVRTAVDRRAIAARNLVLVTKPEDLEAEKNDVLRAHKDVTEYMAKLVQMGAAEGVSDKAHDLVQGMVRIEEKYAPVALAIVDLALKKQTEQAVLKMNEECRPLLAALVNETNAYSQYTERRAEQMIQAAARQFDMERNLLLVACAIAFAAAAFAGLFIVRSLSRALGAEPADLSIAARKVAEGDLSPVVGADVAPAGSVLASLGAMQASLSAIVAQVRDVSDSIANGSSEIATGNADLSQRTEEQASALQQTAATMDQLGTTVRNNADNAHQANQLALGASTVAIKGGEVVSEVVSKMKGINESSRKISDIIGVIDSIAFQTNILALNAAVEAARAGEQGRGFAVVASEVRNLAQRSAQAAKEIKTLISASVDEVEQGSILVDRAGQTMEEVVGAVRRVSDIVGEISSASHEQSAGVGQVGQAVTQMDQVTQQNAALVEQSAAAAESLRVQASQLVQAVSVFSLDKGGRPSVADRATQQSNRRGQLAIDRHSGPARLPQAVRQSGASHHAPTPRRTAVAAGASDEWSDF